MVSIETTAGDLEIADPDEVAQYRHWADLLTEAAVSHGIETLVPRAAAPADPPQPQGASSLR
jgi:hypothetical protein